MRNTRRQGWVTGLMLLAGSGVAAQQPPALEPDTQEHGSAWQDAWWQESTSTLPRIPLDLRTDLDHARAQVASVLEQGVMVDGTLVVEGVPGANAILREHAEKAGMHARNTVVLIPQHARAAGQAYADAGNKTGELAQANAQQAVEGWTSARKAVRDDVDANGQRLLKVDENTGNLRATQLDGLRSVARNEDAAARDAAGQARTELVDGIAQEREQAAQRSAEFGADSARRLHDVSAWTLSQVPNGVSSTRASTLAERDAMVAGTVEAAGSLKTSVLEARKETTRSTQEARRTGDEAQDALQRKVDEGAVKSRVAFDSMSDGVANETVVRIPGVARGSVETTRRDARTLWKLGYQEYLVGGLQTAGDNWFAGDVEGTALGTFYTVASSTQGAGVILVLEPLAATGNAGAGTVQVGALGVGGAAAIVGVQAARVVWTTVGGLFAGASLAGLYALSNGRTFGTAAWGWGLTAGTALWGGMSVGWQAGKGAARTAGAVVGGTVATAVKTGAGAVATAAMATVIPWAGNGLLLLRTVGALAGLVGVGVPGMVGPFVLAVMQMGAQWGGHLGALMALAMFQGGAHLVLPLATATHAVWLFAGAGVGAWWLNMVSTPVGAVWNTARATGSGVSIFAEDPLLAAFHGVVGTAGHAARMTAVGTVATASMVGGTAGAFASAGGRTVHHGARWVVAGTVRGVERAIAPLRFDLQAAWRAERQPQLEEMLRAQPEDVQARVGTEVRYVRAVFAGEDRGKVDFFTTVHNGRQVRFHRKVSKQCEVKYVSDDGKTVLESGLMDRRCVEAK